MARPCRKRRPAARELEADIKTLEGNVSGHKVQLQSLLRELDKISQEKHETVADMITAKEEKELLDMLTGISEDRTTKELQEMQTCGRSRKASAPSSREMAGVDTKRSEAEFLEYAAKNQADSEFDKLIGLAKEPARPAGNEGNVGKDQAAGSVRGVRRSALSGRRRSVT